MLGKVTNARRNLKLSSITAMVFALSAVIATSARADVSNASACRLRAHIVLSSGTYKTTASTVACDGTLAGQLVQDGGSIEIWGRYTEAWSADSGCVVRWRDGVFMAHIKQTLAFDGPRYIVTEGGFEMSGAVLMRVTGTGDSRGLPFIESGLATFTPDPGQSCGGLRSGTLTQRVSFVDGGAGNAAAEESVSGYQRREQEQQSSRASGATPAHHSHHYRGARRGLPRKRRASPAVGRRRRAQHPTQRS